ncbi:MAG: hypothetical protein AUH43_11280 [Acidobacteria bacterium 13_1_40CM_65_14]|nr:MAG: hypothetical protein AUH43_11280 [Acidobacteria bacterium 13_1_40CM_65_14]
MHGRDETEEKTAGSGHGSEKPLYSSIECDFLRARKVRGPEGSQKFDAGPSESDSGEDGADREQAALNEQVPNHPRARRAERRSYCELSTAARHARDEQIRRVRTGNQPHEADRGQREPRDCRDITGDVGLQRHHAPRRLLVLIRRSPQRKDAPVDRAQLVCRRRSCRCIFQPSKHGDEKRSLARRGVPLRRHEKFLRLLQRTYGPRQNTRKLVIRSIEPYRFSNHVGASAEAPLPEAVADDDRRRIAGPAI